MAATIRNRVRRLYLDANALLGDRALPESVRKALGDVPAALKSTWGDLRAQADGEAENAGDIDDAESEADGTDAETPVAEADGASQLLSYEDITRELRRALCRRYGYTEGDWHEGGPWVQEVYGDYLVYAVAGHYYRLGYSWPNGATTGAQPELAPAPEEVQHVTTWEPLQPTMGEVIKHEGDKWVLYSADGSKKLGEYDSEAEAQEREKQVQAFKHASEATEAAPVSEAEELLMESASGGAIALAEADVVVDKRAPLTMDIAIIRPGFGNARDGHYYSRQLLEQYQQAFMDAKMFETDHKPEDRRNDNWVSTVKGVSIDTDGTLRGRVTVHDPDFAERTRNLAALGQLPMLKASIYASGTAHEGEVDGQKAKIVESVTKVHSVDWVTEAGAGGQALALAEAANGATPPEASASVTIEEVTPTAPAPLSRETVEALLAEAGLVVGYRRPLLLATYADAAAVQEAAQAMKTAMREAGAGAPFGVGASATGIAPTTTAAERERKALRNLGIGQQG